MHLASRVTWPPSPDRVPVRGPGGAGAGRHRHREAGRVPHLRGLLGLQDQHLGHPGHHHLGRRLNLLAWNYRGPAFYLLCTPVNKHFLCFSIILIIKMQGGYLNVI